jgi:hypothetical protein
MRSYIEVHLRVKCPLLLSDFSQNWNISQILVKFPFSGFMKIGSAVTELFHG